VGALEHQIHFHLEGLAMASSIIEAPSSNAGTMTIYDEATSGRIRDFSWYPLYPEI